MGCRAHANPWEMHHNDDALQVRHAPPPCPGWEAVQPRLHFRQLHSRLRPTPIDYVINEAAMREYTIWILDCMKLHAAKEVLGSATAAVVPDIAINAVEGRFETPFTSQEKRTKLTL